MISTKQSPRPVDETVSRLKDAIAAKGLKLFRLGAHYGLGDELAARLAGIDAVTDAAITP